MRSIRRKVKHQQCRSKAGFSKMGFCEVGTTFLMLLAFLACVRNRLTELVMGHAGQLQTSFFLLEVGPAKSPHGGAGNSKDREEGGG